MMSVLKKMTGTKDFLALPDETKGCQIDSEDECVRKKYRQELINKCSCVPWPLKQADEVGIDLKYFTTCILLSRMSISVAQSTVPATKT